MTEYPVVTSLWNAIVPPNGSRPARDAEIDVAVVGGGFAGLASAYQMHVADPSLRVAVLERDYVGFGASGRAFGVFAPMHPGIIFGTLARCHGSDVASWAAAYIGRQVQEWKELIQGARVDCEYRACPVLITARSHAEMKLLERCTENLREARVEHRPVGEGDLRELTSFPARRGLLLTRGFATLNPFKLARGLRQLLIDRGVCVYEHTRVAGVHPTAGRVDLQIDDGTRLPARKVVLSTSVHTSGFGLGRGSNGLASAYTYVLATEPLDDHALAKLGPALDGGVIAEARIKYAYTRVHDRRLLFGGRTRVVRTPTEAAEQDQKSYRALHAQMRECFPFLDGTRIQAAWSGPVQIANLARMPVVKAVPQHPNVILNVGYNVDGMSLALLSGKMAAGTALGERFEDREAERLRRTYLATHMKVGELLHTVPWLVRA
jgi:gamma-glutamylputrescine oxidase